MMFGCNDDALCTSSFCHPAPLAAIRLRIEGNRITPLPPGSVDQVQGAASAHGFMACLAHVGGQVLGQRAHAVARQPAGERGHRERQLQGGDDQGDDQLKQGQAARHGLLTSCHVAQQPVLGCRSLMRPCMRKVNWLQALSRACAGRATATAS